MHRNVFRCGQRLDRVYYKCLEYKLLTLLYNEYNDILTYYIREILFGENFEDEYCGTQTIKAGGPQGSFMNYSTSTIFHWQMTSLYSWEVISSKKLLLKLRMLWLEYHIYLDGKMTELPKISSYHFHPQYHLWTKLNI